MACLWAFVPQPLELIHSLSNEMIWAWTEKHDSWSFINKGKYKHITKDIFSIMSTWVSCDFTKMYPARLLNELQHSLWHNFNQILIKKHYNLSAKLPNPLIIDLTLRWFWHLVLTLTRGSVWPNETACLSADVHTHLWHFILGVLFLTFPLNMSTLITAIKSPSMPEHWMTSHAIKCHLSQSVLIVLRDWVPSLSHSRKRQAGAMKLNRLPWRIYF